MWIERAFMDDRKAVVTNSCDDVFGEQCPTPFTDAIVQVQSRLYRRAAISRIFLDARVSEFRGGTPESATSGKRHVLF